MNRILVWLDCHADLESFDFTVLVWKEHDA